MEGISVSGEVGGAGGAHSYDALKRLDQIWSRICSGQEGENFSVLIRFGAEARPVLIDLLAVLL